MTKLIERQFFFKQQEKSKHCKFILITIKGLVCKINFSSIEFYDSIIISNQVWSIFSIDDDDDDEDAQ